MDFQTRARFALLGLAAGVMLALALVPQTRLLLKMQALPASGLLCGNDAPRREQLVKSHPNDYGIQLAGQTSYQGQTQLQYARSLVPRFPDNPSLRANILRYAMLHEIRMARDEDYLLQGQPVPKTKPSSWEQPSTPAQLAAFDADAAAGERLDPDNAYFPFMRSVGLFAAHRDAEGLAAVGQASRKTQWREYMEDEVEGRWRVNENLYGGRETVASLAVSAAVLLPQYSRLRGVARVVTYKAVLAEQSGHPETGLAWRAELARCGYLMTSQSTYLIGNLVGIAISEVARSRPGGAPPWKSGLDAQNDAAKRDQVMRQRLDAYLVYVRRQGREDAAQEALRQFQGEEEVRHLPIGDYMMGEKTSDFLRLPFSLALGWALATNLLTTALLGLAAWGLSRLPFFRELRPLPTGASFGAGIALLFSLAVVFFFHDTRPEDMGGVVMTLLVFSLVPLAGGAVFAALRPAFRRPFIVGTLSALGMLTVLLAFASLSAWKINGAANLLDLVNGGLFSGNDAPNSSALSPPTLLGSAVGLAVPLLLALILTIASRVRRVPVSTGLVRGFCAAVPPIFCGLIFLYGGLLLWTARQETAANYALVRSLHGEGQYLAQLTGQKWPA